MLVLLFTMIATSFANAPIQISITDPHVQAVHFRCAGLETMRVEVKNNKVTVGKEVAKCDLVMERRAGTIDGPGRYTCDLDKCTLDDVFHRPVTDQPGRVNMIFANKVDANSVELICPNGNRTREPIIDNVAVIDDVPTDEHCRVTTRSGTPAQFNKISPGTWRCTILGTTMLCNKQ